MAVPNPELELQRLTRELKKQLPALVLLTGSEGFFRDSAVQAVLAALPKGTDHRTLDGDGPADARDLLDLRGGGLFGGGTWLVVRRGEKWLSKVSDDLLHVLPKIAEGCGLVLETPRLDKRTKLAKELLKVGEVYTFRELYLEPYDRRRSAAEGELAKWVMGRSKQLGVPLTAEAALLITATVGQKPAELMAELEGIAGRAKGKASGRKAVGPEQLRGLLTVGFESTPFEFADAVLARDRRKAERSLEAMFRRGVRSKDGSAMDRGGLFPFITSWLFQQAAQLLEGRVLLEGGTPAADIASQVGVGPFRDRYEAQLRNWRRAELEAGLQALRSAQRALRSTGEDPERVLAAMLVGWFRAAPASRDQGVAGGRR